VLLVFEMLLPGVVFLFLPSRGGAGFDLLVASDLSLELQLVLFAVVVIASADRAAADFAPAADADHRPQPQTPAASHWSARSSCSISRILAGRGRVTWATAAGTVTGPTWLPGPRCASPRRRHRTQGRAGALATVYGPT